MPKSKIFDFDGKVQTFVAICQDRVNRTYAARYPTLRPDVLEIDEGNRYVKVFQRQITPDGVPTNGLSVFAFIDKETGDVLKPAGWKAPAKIPRGNLLSDHGGMEAVMADGMSIRYLS
jgi:hypothetical protein